MIESAELVTDVYGFWPEFQGAYVLSASIESHSELFYEYGDRTLILTLHWWLEAPEHYDGGPIVYSDEDLHRRIVIAFSIEDLTIQTFHCSSTGIDGLPISQNDTGKLCIAGGFESSFSYDAVRVLDVIPCDELGNPKPV